MTRGEYFFRASTIENDTGYMLYFVKKHWADGSESVESGYYHTPQEADKEVDRLNDLMIEESRKK